MKTYSRNIIVLFIIILFFNKVSGQSFFNSFHFGLHGEHLVVNDKGDAIRKKHIVQYNLLEGEIMIEAKHYYVIVGASFAQGKDSLGIVKFGIGGILNSGKKIQFPIFGLVKTPSYSPIGGSSIGIDTRILYHLSSTFALSAGSSVSWALDGYSLFDIRIGVNYSIIMEDESKKPLRWDNI